MSDTNQRIADIVGGNDVVLFMKGTPLFPQCGFSSRAVAILDHCGVAYDSVDVLQDMEIRQGIKAYSDWPTIPQLYVKGEFVGGSDIMMEMFEAGELQQMMDEKQVAKAEGNVRARAFRLPRYRSQPERERPARRDSRAGLYMSAGAVFGDLCDAPPSKT